jgi:hypothetical protein
MTALPGWLLSALRTGVQSGWALLATWALSHGVTLPATAPGVVQALALAVVTGLVTAGIRWLEHGTGWRGRIGRWMMAGLAAPVYGATPTEDDSWPWR